jgi:hypothetical protein
VLELVDTMATATEQQIQQPQVGGAPGQDLVCCNRCSGKGIWTGPRSSGTCFACRGSGLLERVRAEKYLGQPIEQQPDPAAEALAKATAASAELSAMGWIMSDPAQLEGRTELLGRHPKKRGRTLHITWVHAQRTRISEWLEGPPSKHRDLLTEDA